MSRSCSLRSPLVSRTPLRNVPLVLPTSRTCQPSSVARISACLRLTELSSRTTSKVSRRPARSRVSDSQTLPSSSPLMPRRRIRRFTPASLEQLLGSPRSGVFVDVLFPSIARLTCDSKDFHRFQSHLNSTLAPSWRGSSVRLVSVQFASHPFPVYDRRKNDPRACLLPSTTAFSQFDEDNNEQSMPAPL